MSTRRRVLFWLLALALLLAQGLGQVHRSLHGPVLLARAAQALAATDAPPVAVARDADAFGHLSDTDCRLYDQLLHADLLPGVPLVPPPLVLPVTVLHRLAGEALARWAALYDARGPPPTR